MSHANLSRRAIMSGAAALPAVAVLPVSAIARVGNPDAELLRLGAEFQPIIHEWAARRAIELRHGEAWEEVCIRAGLPRIEFGSIPDDEYRAYSDKRSNVRTEYSDEQEAEFDEELESGESVWDDILGRLNPLAREIISHKAQTVAGLAVQTRAMTVYYAELWDGGSIDDDNNHDHRKFIDAVCAFLRITPAPMQSEAWGAREAVQS
jgi:hypothetical protein